MPTATAKKPAPKKAPANEASPVQGRSDLAEGGFTYPAKLVEGRQEKQENGNWQLLMIFERFDRMWDDGNPVRQYVRGTTWFAKSGEAAGPESEADIISKSFAEQTGDGLDVLNDDSLAEYIGHAFLLTDEDTGRTYTDKKDRARKAYLTTCTEYLGDESFEYTGKVTTVQGSGGGVTPAQADPATYIAGLFDGQNIEELKNGGALDIVKDDESLTEVKTVLDKSLRGGLVKPKSVLIDSLINGGYAVDEGGTFVATPAA